MAGVLGSWSWLWDAGCRWHLAPWLLYSAMSLGLWLPAATLSRPGLALYIAEDNDNILTCRCLLGMECLTGAGEQCFSGVSVILTKTLGWQPSRHHRNVLCEQQHWPLDTSYEDKTTKTQSLRARPGDTCLMSWHWRGHASFTYIVVCYLKNPLSLWE